jgi:protein-tyrosine phosphatase
MKAEIFWIADSPLVRLAIIPRPRGGDWLRDEGESLRLAGIDTLVCLLTSEEIAELDLVDGSELCAVHAIQFVSYPRPDRGVPASVQEKLTVVRRLAGRLEQGKSVGIHFRQGVGRSAMLAACVLAALGENPDIAFENIVRARGFPVPDTPEQREWVMKFVDRYLMRETDE